MMGFKDSIERLSETPCTITVVGFPRIGKSSFLNALLAYDKKCEDVLPTSASTDCTAVPIIVKRPENDTSTDKPFKGTLKFISFDEFETKVKDLIGDLESRSGDTCTAEEKNAKEASRSTIHDLFGTEIEDDITLDRLKLRCCETWNFVEKITREGEETVTKNSVSFS